MEEIHQPQDKMNCNKLYDTFIYAFMRCMIIGTLIVDVERRFAACRGSIPAHCLQLT